MASPPQKKLPGAAAATTHTVAASKHAAGPRGSLNDYYSQWEKKVAGMSAASAATDWSKTDFSKLTARDIGVNFGPPMTEEQFKQYREKRGGSVQVVSAADAGSKKK